MYRNLLFLVVLCLCSCGPRERISKEVFDAVNSTMEAKKLSESQILNEAILWGDSISNEAQKQLMDRLHKAVDEKGYPNAVSYCKLEATSQLVRMAEKYGVTIRRTSARPRNPENAPSGEELPILDAYAYNFENGLENEPNIQQLQNGETLLYTKAIVIQEEFCLNCHGTAQKEIKEETLIEIDSRYAKDVAREYKVGQLRGMWSISIPKKGIVTRL